MSLFQLACQTQASLGLIASTRRILAHVYVDACTRADLLVHDAQYTEEEYRFERTWGHSTFSQAMLLAISSKAKKLGFFHHDPDRTDELLEAQVEASRSKLEQEGKQIECMGIREGLELAV